MRILIYGNFSVDYTSENHYAKTLEALGHTVVRLQENTVRTEQVVFQSRRADVFVWIHSHGFKNTGRYSMERVLYDMKCRGVITVGYHLDLYMGLERWAEYENHPYFKVQHFFTVDKLMADWLNNNTETKGHFLEAGVFEPECRQGIYKPELANDIVFTGAKKYHQEWPYRPKLINFLQDTYQDKFSHYGPDGIKTVRGDELNNLYASSKIVVGDTLNIGFNYPYYSSDRFFEATGRGAFLIYPKIEGFAPDYKDGIHVVYYKHGDLDELKEKIDYYLKHEHEREKIRLAGFNLTKNNHTYTQRWATILNTITSTS